MQNGVTRNDEGIGVVYLDIEELESSIYKAWNRSQSRSRSFWNWVVGVGSWNRGTKSSTPQPCSQGPKTLESWNKFRTHSLIDPVMETRHSRILSPYQTELIGHHHQIESQNPPCNYPVYKKQVLDLTAICFDPRNRWFRKSCVRSMETVRHKPETPFLLGSLKFWTIFYKLKAKSFSRCIASQNQRKQHHSGNIKIWDSRHKINTTTGIRSSRALQNKRNSLPPAKIQIPPSLEP